MHQSHNSYCPSTPVTQFLPLHKQTNTGNCTALTTKNIMPQAHNRNCPSTSVTPLLPLHKQTNTGNCSPSLHKTICPNLTNVTVLLTTSHHYCRNISRPIPVTEPPHYTKHYAPFSQQLLHFYPRHTITAAT